MELIDEPQEPLALGPSSDRKLRNNFISGGIAPQSRVLERVIPIRWSVVDFAIFDMGPFN